MESTVIELIVQIPTVPIANFHEKVGKYGLKYFKLNYEVRSRAKRGRTSGNRRAPTKEVMQKDLGETRSNRA